MSVIKMTDDERKYLENMEKSKQVLETQKNVTENALLAITTVMNSHIRQILLRHGIEQVPGTAMPLTLKLDTGEIELGITRPVDGLVIPK